MRAGVGVVARRGEELSLAMVRATKSLPSLCPVSGACVWWWCVLVGAEVRTRGAAATLPTRPHLRAFP